MRRVRVALALVGVVVAVVVGLAVPAGAGGGGVQPPTGLSATPQSQSQIRLSWSAAAGASGYQVLRGEVRGGPYTTVGTVSATSYVDSGLAAGQTYYYVVRSTARNKVSANSVEVSATTLPAAAVRGFRASAEGTRVTLTWLPVTGAIRYDILHYITEVDPDGVVVGSTTGTSYVDTAVVADHRYVYRVRAVFAGGGSVQSVLLTVDNGTTTTRVDLAVSPGPNEVGQSVLLHATVVPSPTDAVYFFGTVFFGTVFFYVDDEYVGRADLDPSAHYALFTTRLTAGAHTVYAHYTGYFYTGSVSIGASSSELVTQAVEANYGQVEFAGAVAVPFAPGSDAATVGIADVTGDGRADLLATTETTSTTDPDDFSLFVFTAEPGGGWLQRQVLRTHASGLSTPVRLACGDVDGDGDTDVLVTAGSGVDVFLQSAGQLQPPTLLPVTGGTVQDALLTDLDADQQPDLVVHVDAGGPDVVVLRNAGAGQFAPPVAVAPVAGGSPSAGDVTGDGLVDLVLTRTFTAEVYAQTATGGFTHRASLEVPIHIGSIGAVSVGDVTGDGRADVTATLAANRPESQIVVYPQTATGELGPPVRYAAYDSPEPVVLADVDRDGRQDLVVAHGGWEQVSVQLQRPNGLLGRPQFSWVPRSSHYDHRGLAAGDINADGKPDVVLADQNHRLILLYQL